MVTWGDGWVSGKWKKKVENYRPTLFVQLLPEMKKVQFVTHIANRICKSSRGEICKLLHSHVHVFTDLDHKLPIFSKVEFAFSHHYQGRIDFNTVNLFHSTGMHLACILSRREGLTNPLPRGKINQSSP